MAAGERVSRLRREENDRRIVAELAALRDRPFRCPNCDVPVSAESFFCRESCRQEARLVRRYRLRREDGRIGRADIQEVFRFELAQVLAGGYDAKARKVPLPTRALVIARDEGRCRRCGKAGDEIDHIRGSSNEAANLQLLCDPCHNAKTRERMVPITPESDPDLWKRSEELLARIQAPLPAKACDSPQWEGAWRSIKLARRDSTAALRARISGRNCPVCLAKLPKHRKLERLRTGLSRPLECEKCLALPIAGQCPGCSAEGMWGNGTWRACTVCGGTSAA